MERYYDSIMFRFYAKICAIAKIHIFNKKATNLNGLHLLV